MLEASGIRTWKAIHKWTSLVCTVFLLILCLTGLPLIFHEEIDELMKPAPKPTVAASSASTANLDTIVKAGQNKVPGFFPHVLSFDDPQVVTLILSKTHESDPATDRWLTIDAATAEVLEDSSNAKAHDRNFMDVILDLHRSLLAGFPGELVLALVAICFVLSLISGAVVYGPLMRKLEFGTVRRDKSTRVLWLDLHNLIGIVTLVWVLVVGITGLFNTLSTPLFGLWQITDVKQKLAAYQDKPIPASLSSLQAAADKALAAVPNTTVASILFPSHDFASPAHYVFWLQGRDPLTSKLFKPALVNADTGEYAGTYTLPPYLKAVELSRPLHFGDYGGLPLKILWAILDMLTIVVLVSGLYLWWVRRRSGYESTLEPNAPHTAAVAKP